MKYVPVPIAMLEVGKPLPVDVWTPDGRLLLRKGLPIESEQHRERLYAHNASTTVSEAQAWQRAYERMVHAMLRDGEDLQKIGRMSMPSEISERDFSAGEPIKGNWLDLQEVLRGILYQGGLAINPLPRLEGIEKKIRNLLQEDTDDSLFRLFQALGDNSLGYSATHALLCAVVCELVAQMLGMPELQRKSLMHAALTMNISMAREQDSLSVQKGAPSDAQKELIREHPQKSMEMLKGLGVDDPDHLNIVRWHHEGEAVEGMSRIALSRQILSTADVFVAKMAGRETRAAQAPLKAAKSIVLETEGQSAAVGAAMAKAVGCYPPGSYARLVTGETVLVVQRGARANAPWVIGVVDKDGMPNVKYTCKNTADPALAIAEPAMFKKGRMVVDVERVRRAREKIPR
jgi:HD-GYP domain-containing protein (c-di-GMP phosphodiesterase class II)